MKASSKLIKKRRLAVFDFDNTIVSQNIDTVARDLLAPSLVNTKELNELAETQGWIEYMAQIFRLLSEHYTDSMAYLHSLRIIPEVPGFVRLLKRLKQKYDYDLIIISDSNSIFIDEWLKTHRLTDCFLKVFTNPAEFDEKGVLTIRPYHEQTECKLSAKNLCKGRVLEHFVIGQDLRFNIHYDTVIYVGDGNNDVCPVLRLRPCDIACPRLGFALDKNITKNHEKLKIRARVIPWKNGFDLLTKLEAEEKLIEPLNSIEGNATATKQTNGVFDDKYGTNTIAVSGATVNDAVNDDCSGSIKN